MSKKKRRRQKRSAAPVIGGIFTAIFIVAAAGLAIMIRSAVYKRDRISQTPAEPFREIPNAVTELDSSSSDTSETTTTTAQTAEAVTTVDPLVVLPDDSSTLDESTENGKKQPAHSINDLSLLRAQLSPLIDGFAGDWQVYVHHMDSETELVINNDPVYAASMIKLFAAGAAYQQVSEGKLDPTTADNYIRPMISISSNEAFDEIVELLGQNYITEWCRQHGYWDTVVTHEIATEESYVNNRVSADDNSTSVRDVGRFLSALYRGEIVDREYSDKIISFMEAQQFRDKIPAGIPEDVLCANKTGETDDVNHDGAIVYSDTGDYVIVVMGSTPQFGWTADGYITLVSETVYNYFNVKTENTAAAEEDEDEDTNESAESNESSSDTESNDSVADNAAADSELDSDERTSSADDEDEDDDYYYYYENEGRIE